MGVIRSLLFGEVKIVWSVGGYDDSGVLFGYFPGLRECRQSLRVRALGILGEATGELAPIGPLQATGSLSLLGPNMHEIGTIEHYQSLVTHKLQHR